MTLIVHLPATNGLVMASDGQGTTTAGLKFRVQKIHKLNDTCIWGAAGDTTLIERVEEHVANLSGKGKPLEDLCVTLREIIPECVKELSFDTPPSPPREAQFAFIEYRDNPRILYLRENGSAWWTVNVPSAFGSGNLFAHALLRKYQSLGELDLDLGAVLAYKVIAETIDVVEGVGPPIDVWQLPPVKNLSQEEVDALEDTYRGLRDAELQMFLSQAGEYQKPNTGQ